MRKILLILIASVIVPMVMTAAKPTLSKPDLEAIKRATTDENDSVYYYPRLLAKFMSTDTTMTPEQFQYFYYGTYFQEDYDPYRGPVNADELKELERIYSSPDRKRSELQRIERYAIASIEDNPVNLRQLTNRIFVFEQKGKLNEAKIWQYKLNRLLLVIASSGSGAKPEDAWIVVYPQDEYDFLNMSNHTAIDHKFISDDSAKAYDYISVKPKTEDAPKGYYFDISEVLKQYYAKHPGEVQSPD